MAIGHVTVQQQLRLLGTVFDGKTAGNAERVKAVHVAASGQHRRRAQNIAAWRGANVASVKCAQHGIDFGVFGQHGIGGLKLTHQRHRRIITTHGARFEGLFNAAVSHQRLY